MKIKIINGFPRLLVSTTIINNGVRINKLLYIPNGFIGTFGVFIKILRNKTKKYQYYNDEAGVYLSHLRVTRPEDSILAIGLGTGSTLIPMVKLMEPYGGGFYRCIEASSSQIELAKTNIDLNNIDPYKYEILNAFAGSKVYEAYGEIIDNNINLNDFDFDILELDCEGSELSILTSLTKRPRNIIVELHPKHFDEKYKDFNNLLMLMEEKEYKYLFAYGHGGDYLDIEDAREYYNSTNAQGEKDSCIEDRNRHFFGVCPIVVTFIYRPLITENY